LAEILAKLGRMSFDAARAILGDLKLEKYVPARRAATGGEVQEPQGISSLGKAHCAYLKKRGFDPETLERLWHIRGISLASKLAWRVYIPIILNGETVSWTTRSIGTKGLRYVSASADQEKIHHKETLYGIDLARSTVIITEGPTDVWNIGPGAVCMFGLKYTPAQFDLMKKFAHRVVCLDSSRDAQKVARSLIRELSQWPGQNTNVVLDSEDPGSASAKEIRLLREAVL